MEVHASNAGSTCADRSADVKRCYVMRNALALLDFEDESIGDLKRLLLRAAFSPIFLRCKEGRRYLAHLFTLEVRIVGSEALHDMLAAPSQNRQQNNYSCTASDAQQEGLVTTFCD